MHGEVYSREFGFDGGFEINIADKVVKYFSEEDEFSRVWIAEVDDRRAGSVAIRKLAEEIGFINFVVVLDQYRGQGIANTLMEKALGHGRAKGCKKFRLETFTCLESARKLYEKLGFKIVESASINQFGVDLVREFWELDD